jgi:molybdate transport system substrate-binding protein
MSTAGATLKLISSMASRDVLAELAAEYQRITQQALRCEAAGGVDIARRVRADEDCDIVVLAGNVIDKLIEDGKLLTHSRVDLMRSGVAMAVRAGAPRPAIDTEHAVKQAVLAATSLGYSTGPSGMHLEKTFERWGVLQQIRDRIVIAPPGVAVASLIANGDVQLGFQQLSELMNVPGIAVVGPLPPAIQSITTFSGGIATRCRTPEGARAALSYMASPSALAAKLRYGMQAG